MIKNINSPNPFSESIWGEYNPTRVFGRSNIIHSILELATEQTPRVINLVGSRWIGKSVVLKTLSRLDNDISFKGAKITNNLWFEINRVIPLYVDLNHKFDIDNPFQEIARKSIETLKERNIIDLTSIASKIYLGQDVSDLGNKEIQSTLRFLIPYLSENKYRLLLCIDHLERTDFLKRQENIRFLSFMAEFSSTIIATRNVIMDIFPGVVESPIAHKLRVKVLGLIDEPSAMELLAWSPRQERPSFSEEDRTHIVKIIGQHPYLLILAAYEAFELLRSPSKKIITANDVRNLIGGTLDSQFEYYWLEFKNQLIRFFEIKNKKIGEDDWDTRKQISTLQKAAIIIEDPTARNNFTIFSVAFEDFIRNKLEKENLTNDLQPSNKIIEKNEILDQLSLTDGTKEGQLLLILLDNPGKMISDLELLEKIWGDIDAKHALDTTVARLRNKIKQSPFKIPGKLVRYRNRGLSFELFSQNENG